LASAFACCPPGRPGFSGGEDTLGWNLVRQIARFHEVWTITNAEWRSSIDQALEDDPTPNLHFLYVELPRWLRPLLRIQGGHQFYYYLWQINAYLAARHLHRNNQFHLFHHITYANDWMTSFIGALLPIHYVRGPGGGAHRTPTGFETEYTLGGQIWEKVRSIGQWLFRRDPFFRMGQHRASALLVCNEEAAAAMPKNWSQKTRFFPVNGVSSADLALSPSANGTARAPDGPFRVLSAGSLIRVKGFGLAIKAFKEFSDRHPDAEFDIIGSGPEQPRLQSLIQSLDLGTKVHLLPHMMRSELLERMGSHDVFLFPSLRDGGGAVVIEAMAVGKPVVCLDTGGPGMHITEEWGVKIKPRSPKDAIQELASALEHLYLDQDLRRKLGQAAHERAENFYHWDKLGEQLMEIYEETLATSLDS